MYWLDRAFDGDWKLNARAGCNDRWCNSSGLAGIYTLWMRQKDLVEAGADLIPILPAVLVLSIVCRYFATGRAKELAGSEDCY